MIFKTWCLRPYNWIPSKYRRWHKNFVGLTYYNIAPKNRSTLQIQHVLLDKPVASIQSLQEDGLWRRHNVDMTKGNYNYHMSNWQIKQTTGAKGCKPTFSIERSGCGHVTGWSRTRGSDGCSTGLNSIASSNPWLPAVGTQLLSSMFGGNGVATS